jgi:hypothetical protein
MTLEELFLYAAFIVALFVWTQWKRKSTRLTRVLGALALGVVFFVLSWLAGFGPPGAE